MNLIVQRSSHLSGTASVPPSKSHTHRAIIFASLAYGAIKTAHISEYLATPSSQYLGVTPSDIENYDLPTDSLTKEDINALKSELTDPRFQDSFWKEEIKLQLKLGKKSEQQALAKYGLDYVTDTYLPEKLAEMGITKK